MGSASQVHALRSTIVLGSASAVMKPPHLNILIPQPQAKESEQVDYATEATIAGISDSVLACLANQWPASVAEYSFTSAAASAAPNHLPTAGASSPPPEHIVRAAYCAGPVSDSTI